MARNGSGVYNLPAASYPAVSGTLIESAKRNSVDSDIATALTSSIAVDGQSVITANIPFATNRITTLGAGVSATDAANVSQVQSGGSQLLTTVAGTNTVTAVLVPSLTAYASGQQFRFVAAGANTGAVTININGLGAKAITRDGTTALVTGDILANAAYIIHYDGTQFQLLKSSAINLDKIQPITSSAAAGALTITLLPTLLDYRSATLTSGIVATVVNVGNISTVISSGSTAGGANGVALTLVVLAINNAGTTELAWTNLAGGINLDETGVITTVAEGGAGAADSATVIYSTTARTNVAYRMVGYLEITNTTAGTWLAPTLIQGMGGNAFKAVNYASYLRLNTANGYGSTNTAIRRFTNIVNQAGPDITYADSVTLGGTFTINTSATYSISFSDQFTAAAGLGITINSTTLATGIGGVAVAEILGVSSTPAANLASCASFSGYLAAGSVIRAHTGGTAAGTSTTFCQFSIARVN